MSRWDKLSMGDRAALVSLFVNNGVVDPKEMRRIYDEGGDTADIKPAVIEASYPREKEVLELVGNSKADFVSRLKDAKRATIPDWEGKGDVATHKLGYAEVDGKYVVYPLVQNIGGKLYDFSDPQYGMDKGWQALDSALYAGDYVELPSEADARWFTESYKNHYPGFNKYDGKTEKSQEMKKAVYTGYYQDENGKFRRAFSTIDDMPQKKSDIRGAGEPYPTYYKDLNVFEKAMVDATAKARNVDDSEIERFYNDGRLNPTLEAGRAFVRKDPDTGELIFPKIKKSNTGPTSHDSDEVFDIIDPSVKSAIDLRGLSRRQIKDKAYNLAGEYGNNDDLIGTKRQKRIFNLAQKRWYNKGLEKNVDRHLIDAAKNGDQQAFNDYITRGRDKFATKYAFPIIAGGISGPAGMLAGMANTVFDAGINQTTGGLRDSWGDLLADRYSHPVLSSFLEFTNPLNFSSSKISGRLKGEHFYDILDDIERAFGKDSKEYKAAIQTKPDLVFQLRDKTGSVQAYDDNVIRYTPWTSKTSLAHEFGHSIGDKLESKGIGKLYDNGRYIYDGHNVKTTDNRYIDSVLKEFYADAFRQIVRPYKGFNKDLKFRARIADEYLNDGMPDFTGWSKSGEEVPAFLRKEYSDIYRKERLDFRDIYKDAAKLGIDPHAYLQMKSRAYANYLKYFGGKPNIQYHGAPYTNATIFPQKSHPLYKGQTRGTGTGLEGIYLTNQKRYAERYEQPGIGVHVGYKPDWYNGGKTYIVSAGVNPINITDPAMGKMPAWILQNITPDNRAYIESLGYNGITGTTGFGFNETAVFSPNQIKSLEGNIGYFNPWKESIYE